MMSSAFRTPRRVTPAYTSLNRRYSFYFGMLFVFFIGFQVYALLSLGNAPPTSSEQTSQSNANNNDPIAINHISNSKKEDTDYTNSFLKPSLDQGTVFFKTDTLSQTNGNEPVPNTIPSPKNPIKRPPSPFARSTELNQVAPSKHANPHSSPSPKQKEQQISSSVLTPQQSTSSHPVSSVSVPSPIQDDLSNPNETEPFETSQSNTIPQITDTKTSTVPTTSDDTDLLTIVTSPSDPISVETSSQQDETSETESAQAPEASLFATVTLSEESPTTKEDKDSVAVPPVTQPSNNESEESLNADNSTLSDESLIPTTNEDDQNSNTLETTSQPIQSPSSIETAEPSTIVGPVTNTPETVETSATTKDIQTETDKEHSTPKSSIDWNTYTLPTTSDEKDLKEISDWLKAKNKEVKILFWDKISGFMGNHMLRLPPKCDIPCAFSEARDEYNTSNAVVFHIPQFSDFPKAIIPDQLWVAYSMESEEYYTRLKDPKFMSRFNLTMSYKLSSDIMAGYFNSNVTYYMTPPYPKNETEIGLAAFIASNCVRPRLTYVQELSKHIKVDSLGKCMHNKNFSLNITNGGLLKFHTIKRYKFYLAFENHEAQDYVTEKFFHAIASGTVPVYWGAPNIEQFLPSNHSVINVKDFESAEQLANYLTYLDQNPSEYEKYLEWKKTGPSQQFLDLISKQKLDARCRLCIKAGQQLRQLEEGSSSLPSDVQ